MKQFNALFRVSFLGLIHSLGFRGKNKRKTDQSGWFNLGLMLFFNLLFAVMYGGSVAVFMFQAENPAMFVSMMALFGTIFCMLFTLLGAKEVVFSTKDIDLVLSLPINGSFIILARLFALYLENAMMTMVWMLFSGVAWAVMGGGSFLYLPLFLGMGFLVAILPTLLSLLIGVVMAVVSARSGGKSVVESALYLVGTVLLIVFIFGIQQANVTQNIPEKMTGVLTPFQWMGDACLGDWMAWIWVVLITVLPMAIVVLLCGRFYYEILGSLTARSSKNNYKLGRLKHGGVTKGLLKKEWLRYLNTPIYLANTGFGLVFYLVMAIGFALKSDDIWAQFTGADLRQIPILGLAAAVSGFLLSCTLISACSVSLEGNAFWILRTTPLPGAKILMTKVWFHWLVCAPFVLLASLVIAFGGRMDVVSAVLLVALGLLFTWCVAVLGLLINLKLPKLDGSSDSVVVKQSASVGIAMLVNMILLVVLGLVWGLTGTFGTQQLSALVCLIVTAVVAVCATVVLKRWGESMLNSIEV